MIADMLRTPVAFFFEGAPLSDLPSGQFSLAARISYAPDLYSTSECIALAKSFSQIKSGAVRGQLMHLIEELANLNEGTELAELLGQ